MLGWDVLLGGLTGLVGNLITGVMNYKTMKAKNAHEAKMVALETAAMKAEAKMQIEIKRTEIEGAVELADSAAFMEGIKQGNKQLFSDKWVDKLFAVEGWMKYPSVLAGIFVAICFGFVDWLRGFMRPALTVYLTGMASVITWMAWRMIQSAGVEEMTIAQAISIYNETTSIIIYLTVSCVTWWFGDRRMAKFITELNKNGKK